MKNRGNRLFPDDGLCGADIVCIRYGNAGCKLYGSISSNAQKDVWTDRRLFAGNGGADLPWLQRALL